MSSIWEHVGDALAGLGWPVAADQMLVATGQELPDRYLVYFLIASPPAQHADDVEELRADHVQVSAFSRTGFADLPDIDGAMLTAGFTHGPDRGLPYNPQTRHYGLAKEFWILEEKDNGNHS